MVTHRFVAGDETAGLGTRSEIEALDRRFAGATAEPELDPLLHALMDGWESRAPLTLGAGVYPALPRGVARLIHALREQGVTRLALDHDLDGIAAHWPSEIVEDPSDADAVVLSVPGTPGWLDRLDAIAARGPEKIAARVRAPFDTWWQSLCRESIVHHFRHDCEPYLVPGPMVLDGGGDHWVVSSIAAPDRSTLPRHGYRDFDGLAPDACDETHLRSLIDRVGVRLGATPVLGDVLARGESLTAVCFFDDGVGFNLELSPRERHLLLTFAPYDERVETTAVSSVYETLGSPHTRTRPLRTVWTPTEMIF